jgi:hypothetical protein
MQRIIKSLGAQFNMVPFGDRVRLALGPTKKKDTKYNLTCLKARLLTMTCGKVKHNQGLTTMVDKFTTSRQADEIKGVQIDLW